jgi:F-type H+-transporting ATPase subunit delta
MPQDSRVSKRYAKSLLDFAVEKGVLEEVRSDMALLEKTFKASKELAAALKSPVIKLDVKANILRALFADKVNSITIEFVRIVAKKNRESIIPDIARSFAGLYLEYKGIVTAEVITAVALSDNQRNKLHKFISTFSNKVELKEKIDPKIIGGFIVQVGDKQFDESIASRLIKLKTELTKNPYIAKI